MPQITDIVWRGGGITVTADNGVYEGKFRLTSAGYVLEGLPQWVVTQMAAYGRDDGYQAIFGGGSGLPAGGLAFQMLAKASSADGDAYWTDDFNIKTYSEAAGLASGGAIVLDCSTYINWLINLNTNSTVTITNAPTNRVTSLTVMFVGDGTSRSVTWPGSVTWRSGSAPSIPGTLNKRTVITLLSFDGALWIGDVWVAGV